MTTTNPFGWLGVVEQKTTDQALYAYVEALRGSTKTALQRATVAYNTLKTVREKLGLDFIPSAGGEGSANTGGWASDLEVQAQDLHAMAVFLDQIALDVKNGKRDLIWNKAFGAFAVSALPSDVIRLDVTQGGVPVIVDASTGKPIHVEAPLGVGAVNWAELAVVAAIPTVGIYLTTTKFLDSMTVVAEQKTQRTLLEAAKKNADLVAQGKATPAEAKQLNDGLYAGATGLQKEQNAVKLAAEKTSSDWSDSLTKVAWAGVIVAGIVTVGRLIPSKGLLENPRYGWVAEMFVEGKWSRNAIVLPSKKQAEAYARDLFSRWTMPTDKRVKRVAQAPNYEWTSEGLKALEEGVFQGHKVQ